MKDFKELRVWQKAHSLALEVYQATRSFPRDEIYGLTSQIRRAAVSVGANIAEGCGRRSDGEFARFLQIARGSASELEYHLLFARDRPRTRQAFAPGEVFVGPIEIGLAHRQRRLQLRGRVSGQLTMTFAIVDCPPRRPYTKQAANPACP